MFRIFLRENFELYVFPMISFKKFFIWDFMFFPWLVSKSSFEMFENGYISSEHLIQTRLLSFFVKIYVFVLILLHLICTQMLQLSHWVAWCEFATAFKQILQGNFNFYNHETIGYKQYNRSIKLCNFSSCNLQIFDLQIFL